MQAISLDTPPISLPANTSSTVSFLSPSRPSTLSASLTAEETTAVEGTDTDTVLEVLDDRKGSRGNDIMLGYVADLPSGFPLFSSENESS